jgi:hypothetical protein
MLWVKPVQKQQSGWWLVAGGERLINCALQLLYGRVLSQDLLPQLSILLLNPPLRLASCLLPLVKCIHFMFLNSIFVNARV